MEFGIRPRGLALLPSVYGTRTPHFLYTTPRTWHPHDYGKPPQRPTPFFISNILGSSDKTASSKSNVDDANTFGRNNTSDDNLKEQCKCGGCLSGIKEIDRKSPPVLGSQESSELNISLHAGFLLFLLFTFFGL